MKFLFSKELFIFLLPKFECLMHSSLYIVEMFMQQTISSTTISLTTGGQLVYFSYLFQDFVSTKLNILTITDQGLHQIYMSKGRRFVQYQLSFLIKLFFHLKPQ